MAEACCCPDINAAVTVPEFSCNIASPAK